MLLEDINVEDEREAAREEGFEDGREEGREMGLVEGRAEIAQKMKAAGESFSKITDFTGLSAEEIGKL
jgi:predicted transposase/invertase (TIGR01784 family)